MLMAFIFGSIPVLVLIAIVKLGQIIKQSNKH